MKNNYKRIAEDILSLAGVKINGNNPWDISIYNDNFYRRAITEGEPGLMEYSTAIIQSGNNQQVIHNLPEKQTYNFCF